MQVKVLLSTGPIYGSMHITSSVLVYGIVKWMLSQDWQIRPLLMVTINLGCDEPPAY